MWEWKKSCSMHAEGWKPTISIVFLSMALRFYHFLSMKRLFLSFLSFWVVFLSVSISFTRFGGCFYLFLLFLSVSIVSIVSIHFLQILKLLWQTLGESRPSDAALAIPVDRAHTPSKTRSYGSALRVWHKWALDSNQKCALGAAKHRFYPETPRKTLM